MARKGIPMFFFFLDDNIDDNIIIYNTDDGKANVKLYANDGTLGVPSLDGGQIPH